MSPWDGTALKWFGRVARGACCSRRLGYFCRGRYIEVSMLCSELFAVSLPQEKALRGRHLVGDDTSGHFVRAISLWVQSN